MLTFKSLVEKLNGTGTTIISMDSDKKVVKFIANVTEVNRTVYATIGCDNIEGNFLNVEIPNGCSGGEKVAVKKEIRLQFGL